MRAREGGRLASAAQPQHMRIEKAARAFLVKLKPPIGDDPIGRVRDFDRHAAAGASGGKRHDGWRGGLVHELQRHLGQQLGRRALVAVRVKARLIETQIGRRARHRDEEEAFLFHGVRALGLVRNA